MNKNTLPLIIGAAVVVGLGAMMLSSANEKLPKPSTDAALKADASDLQAGDGNAQAASIKEIEEGVASMMDDRWLVNEAPLSTDYVAGNPEAPVTVIEYASLSCSHCANFSNKHYPTFKKKYIDTGKVTFILRQYPINEPAFKGALLVDCVGEKEGADRYYTFNKVLFDAQKKWAFDSDYESALKTFAKVGGVAPQAFDACVNDIARETKLLQAKKDAGEQLKISRTPYFFVGGQPFEGKATAADLGAAVDQLLASAPKAAPTGSSTENPVEKPAE